MHDTVAVPFTLRLVGIIAPQFKPLGLLPTSATVPVSPWTSAIVIVDFCDDPTLVGPGCVATIEKSGGIPNVKVAVAVWLRDPLVPFTVTL